MGEALFEYMLKSENLRIRGSAKFLIDTFGETRDIEGLITEIESQIARLKDSEAPENCVQRGRIGTKGVYSTEALGFSL
jgi:hypothetical protein